jgi:2-amino-4-hydroxy-6-hydroxymethyldihydropteridine diphosphokinase
VLYPWSLIDPAAELNGERVGDLAAKAADFADLETFDGFRNLAATDVSGVSGAVERP